jgi:hypothetical protein
VHVDLIYIDDNRKDITKHNHLFNKDFDFLAQALLYKSWVHSIIPGGVMGSMTNAILPVLFAACAATVSLAAQAGTIFN